MRIERGTDFRSLLVRIPDRQGTSQRYQRYERIPAGNIWMSVQAHEGAYCEPRAVLADPFQYKAMEVALLNENDFWVSPQQGNWPEELAKCEEASEYWGEHDDVAAYVPVRVIQRVYDILCARAP